MSSEAIEAAAYDAADRTIDAIEQRKDLVFNGMFDPEVKEIAQAVLDAVEAIIRADERAKVAEEIAKAIEDAQDEDDAYWDAHPELASRQDVLKFDGNNAARIARQHAGNGPESHGDATTAPPEGSGQG